MTEYFFTEKINHDPEALFINGFLWLIEDLDEGEIPLFHIPMLTHLRGMLETFFEKKSIKVKNKEFFINGIKIHLSTDKNMPYFQHVRIFSYLARSDQMDKVESKYHKISKIRCTPWLNDNLDDWKQTRQAKKIE